MNKEFEKEFESKKTEITVLIKEKCTSAAVLDDNWLHPSVRFVAYIPEGSNEVIEEEGRLEWLVKKSPFRKGWGFDFEKYQICKLRVRKCIPKELKPYQMQILNRRYLVEKIVDKDVKNDMLQQIKQRLEIPVTIKTKYGIFVLDRGFSTFNSAIQLSGNKIEFFLSTDEENGETADGAIKAFENIADNFEQFDKKNRESAANELLELANEWLADDDRADKPEEITKEMFMESIKLSEINIKPNGRLTVYYLDGDMFWGHVIEMRIDPDWTCKSANIAG